MSAYSIILRPVLTEKSTIQRELLNQYVFEVAPGANKIQIRQAIEEIFGVKVSSVRVHTRRGKLKRIGRLQGQRPNRKRAIITLKAGEQIQLFESA